MYAGTRGYCRGETDCKPVLALGVAERLRQMGNGVVVDELERFYWGVCCKSSCVAEQRAVRGAGSGGL